MAEIIYKRCPRCGSENLEAEVKTVSKLKVTEDNEYKIEPSKESEIISIICSDCKKELTVEELVVKVACKKCGKLFKKEYIDENGECDFCRFVGKHPEYKDTSLDDLVHIILSKCDKESTETEEVVSTEEATSSVEEAIEAVDDQIVIAPETEPLVEPEEAVTEESKEKAEEKSKSTGKTKKQGGLKRKNSTYEESMEKLFGNKTEVNSPTPTDVDISNIDLSEAVDKYPEYSGDEQYF